MHDQGEAGRPQPTVGLGNVDDRLRAAFGEDYGLVVETAPDAGTKVIVRLPKFAPGVCSREGRLAATALRPPGPLTLRAFWSAVLVGCPHALGLVRPRVNGERCRYGADGRREAWVRPGVGDEARPNGAATPPTPETPPTRPTRLTVLAVDDEAPALDEVAYLLRGDPRVGTILTAGNAAQVALLILQPTRTHPNPTRSCWTSPCPAGRRRPGPGAVRATPAAGRGVPVRARQPGGRGVRDRRGGLPAQTGPGGPAGRGGHPVLRRPRRHRRTGPAAHRRSPGRARTPGGRGRRPGRPAPPARM